MESCFPKKNCFGCRKSGQAVQNSEKKSFFVLDFGDRFLYYEKEFSVSEGIAVCFPFIQSLEKEYRMEPLRTSHIVYDPAWGVEPIPEIPPDTVYTIFSKTAKQNPQKTALIFMGKKISFAELQNLVTRFASGLLKMGVRPGDRVASLLPNSPQQVLAFLAVNRIGAIYVPINVMYKEEELSYVLSDSGATVLISLDLFLNNFLAIQKDTAISTVVVSRISDFLPFPINFLYSIKSRLDKSHVAVSYNATLRPFRSVFAEPVPELNQLNPGPEDTAMILYTAGTTGKSKGVMLTNRNFVYNSINQVKNFHYTFAR